jgi:predicted dehydrogenase
MGVTGARRLMAGMVGGGVGADIGKTHRFAIRLDDRYVLAAGVFGQNAASSAQLGKELGVAEDRIYASYSEMAEREAARPDGIDVAIIATPNDSHFAIASTFLQAGISVVCEKPLTQDSENAAELVRLADENDLVLAVPHCYSAYAMVRHAARLVRDGELGSIRFVAAEHASGWNATPLELTGHKQAVWRTDPKIAGRASVVGDLGTHAYHLVRYITGLDAEQVSARMDTLVPGRRVFDNAVITARLSGDVAATIWASMAASGHNHGLRIRVFGDQGSLEWQHEDPHHLVIQDLAGETRILTQGMSNLSEDAARLTRVGLGHPEGFLEAFANFYRDLADELQARLDGTPRGRRELSFPTGEDGLLGVQFVEAVTRSHDRDGAWTEVPGSVCEDYYVAGPGEGA